MKNTASARPLVRSRYCCGGHQRHGPCRRHDGDGQIFRLMYQGRVDVGAKKAVPDWPLRCPKCKREGAAVLLFQSYDCRYGCYGVKAGGL